MKSTVDTDGRGPPVPGTENIQGAIGRAAIWLFPRILRLYPGRFYTKFAEEMVDVFTQAVHDAALQGIIPLLGFLFSELSELPVTLIVEHIYERKKRSMTPLQFNTLQEIRLARWFARGLSLLIAGFVLWVTVLNEDVLAEITPPMLILLMLCLFALSAWRWERVGGILTMSFAPLLFLAILLQYSNASGLMTPIWVLSLIAASMAYPFLIAGWLFVSVAQHTEVTKQPGGDHGAPVPRVRRLRTYLAVVVLGMMALALFFIPMLVPVQQEFEALPERFFDYEGIIGALRAERAVVGVSSIPAQQPFLSVVGQELDVNGEIVQAYEYRDTTSATADASAIYYDTDNPAWNDTSHFYQVANVILIYEGHEAEILSLLEEAFGPPFAQD